MTEKLAEGKNPGINGGFDRVVDRRTALKIIGGILGGSALAALGVTEVIEKIIDANASKEAAAIPISPLTKKTIAASGSTATEKPTASTQATATKEVTKTPENTPTATPETLSDQESLFYKPEVVVPVTFTVDGVTLNWKIGLMNDVVEKTGIKNLIIHQGGDYDSQWDFMGRAVLKLGWENYKLYTDPSTSYDAYCQLVNNNGGGIYIGGVNEATAKDENSREDIKVCPKNLVLLCGGDGTNFPVLYGGDSGYIGVGKSGNMIMGDNNFGEAMLKQVFSPPGATDEEINGSKSHIFEVRVVDMLLVIGISNQVGYNDQFIRGQFDGDKQFDTNSAGKEVGADEWLLSLAADATHTISIPMAIEVVH